MSADYISGITFCGGEPMHPKNAFNIKILALRLRKFFPNKSFWCYTGHLFEDVKVFVEDMDVVIDGPFRKNLRDVTLAWRGSSNQRVIDVKKSLKENTVVLVDEILNKE